MSGFISKTSIALLLCSPLLFTGCSSDDSSSTAGTGTSGTNYTGNEAAATITSVNAEDIGTTSGEAAQQAATSNGSFPTGIIVNSSVVDIDELTAMLANHINSIDIPNLPTGVTINGSCGGSVSMPDTAQPASGPYTLTITYNNYCDAMVDSTYTFNGTLTFSYDDISNPVVFTMEYINFTITSNSETTTINMTVTCTASSCTYTSDYVASDGSTHRVSDFTISGSASTGFTGSFTFYHYTYGSMSISIVGIAYGGSCGVFPNGGTINFSSSAPSPGGSSGSITYNSDCTYSGTWNNGTSSGSF